MFARMFEGAWWAFGGAKPPQAPPISANGFYSFYVWVNFYLFYRVSVFG